MVISMAFFSQNPIAWKAHWKNNDKCLLEDAVRTNEHFSLYLTFMSNDNLSFIKQLKFRFIDKQIKHTENEKHKNLK